MQIGSFNDVDPYRYLHKNVAGVISNLRTRVELLEKGEKKHLAYIEELTKRMDSIDKNQEDIKTDEE